MKSLSTTKSTLAMSIGLVMLALTTVSNPAHAEQAPNFIQETFPQQGVDSAWESYQSVFFGADAVLDGKTKELMALAVSAQVPCDYCIYYHTRAAHAHGATDAEVREALAVAGLIRKWSTVLNGAQYDSEQWQREVDAMFSGD